MASKVAPAKTADTMLKRIEQFLATAPSNEARRLWSVMTALRGPDLPELGVKTETTCRIRTLAFPSLAFESDSSWSVSGATFASRVDAQRPISLNPGASPHFNFHIIDAVNALSAMGRGPEKRAAK